jgi:peptidoglycan/LPS O-acetylase OafA/YrhL
MSSSKSVYFPNLNGIRFIAALLVVISHVGQFKPYFGYPDWGLEPTKIIGRLGVLLFFALSGFLITYLLLTEEKNFKKISIKDFYIRRVLRIWPLYFFVIIVAFLILPNFQFFIVPGFERNIIYDNFGWKALLYFTFFANMGDAFFAMIPFASQAWSIGTEEQFYLIWPVLISKIKKHRILLMFSVVFFYVLVFAFLHTHFSENLPHRVLLQKFWWLFNIDCMAIGGFFAISLHTGKYLKLFLNKWLFYIVLIGTIAMIGRGIIVPYVHNEVYAFLFGIIILNFAANKEIGISLENKILHYLGKISYGIYMYHILAIVMCIKLLMYLNLMSDWILIPLSLGVAILMASISYTYFESRFIRRKKKFSKVISGENVQETPKSTESGEGVEQAVTA